MSKATSKRKPFTVIGFDARTREIRQHHVEAKDTLHAFAVAARIEHDDDNDFEMVVAVAGHLKESDSFGYPGDGLVDAETVLEQPEVFGRPSRFKVRPSPIDFSAKGGMA